MITTGVTGSTWRASVTECGDVQPWDGDPIAWFVAADDRWHVPAREPAVRQIRIDGTPVTETRVRVPNGDVVQRIFSVVDVGGITVIEVENESTLPVAVAFDRRDVLTERPIPDVPVEGIDLPSSAFVLPVGHHAAVRIGIPHGTGRAGRLPDGLPSARQVARGWILTTDRASRFALPDGAVGAGLAERIVSERCELALGAVPHADDDPAAYCVALGELVRMGEAPGPWLPELVDAVAAIGGTTGWRDDRALAAADRVLAAAGERRARRDLDRIRNRRSKPDIPVDVPDDVLAVSWLEQVLVDGGAMFPAGLPSAWLGQSVEAHGVPTGATSALSFALRWHGPRPAVLWEQTGTPTTLCAPLVAATWATDESDGEALWPEPTGAALFDVGHRAGSVSGPQAGSADPPVSFT